MPSGVLGPNGRGLAAAVGVQPDLVMGTLGKLFGVAGAFVAASEATVSLIRNRARSFVYTTAPPPMLARAAIAALELVRDAEDARQTLLSHAGALRPGSGNSALMCRTARARSPCFNRPKTIGRCGSRRIRSSNGVSSSRDSTTDRSARHRQASADADGDTSTGTDRKGDRRIRIAPHGKIGGPP